jgi:hypothetical protein
MVVDRIDVEEPLEYLRLRHGIENPTRCALVRAAEIHALGHRVEGARLVMDDDPPRAVIVVTPRRGFGDVD